MQKMEVSVIIPCYNREKTIKRCIKSVINQTFAPHEIIIVDDGSNDRTVEFVRNINCDKIKLLKQNHRGAQAARNLGIVNATGNYIAFLDSDDEWDKDILAVFCDCLKNQKEEKVLYCDCIVHDEAARKKSLWKQADESGWVDRQILQKSFVLFGGLLVPKNRLEYIALLDENVVAYQEWDTAIRLSEVCPFFHIKEPLLFYNLHKGDTISKDLKKDIEGYAYIIKKHKKKIIKKLGYQVLAEHYKSLMRRSLRLKHKMSGYFFIRFLFLFILYNNLAKYQNRKEEKR